MKESLGIESLFHLLKILAEQVGIEVKDWSNKLEVVRAIYEKYEENPKETSNLYDLVSEIYQLAEDDKIYPSIKPTKLTFNGSIWTFERTPDYGEYVAGDLYVNSNKVGTYNGFTCYNTLSGWEEAALAIESQSFGNQAVTLIRENNGEWQIK